MTSLKTSIKTITYLSDIGCLEIQGASLTRIRRQQYFQQYEVPNETHKNVVIENSIKSQLI
ncbi:hypothetical protein A3X76_17420 [Salmonella enterica subsp. enterica serovar Johannesburg]|nr:hypothetical protein [Salmonella enterica subsp. enterica serovar Johannesburg]ECT5701843.1 hypothetical protein [Salmonella enterica subsp. enterica serovar Johannesburg]